MFVFDCYNSLTLLLALFLQFATGLYMPAKTVVFTGVKKFDGDSHRYIGSVEELVTVARMTEVIVVPLI
ncbi:DExH-box ATP-dependent RNA helicase DExH10 [Bienertia sinuspersici]